MKKKLGIDLTEKNREALEKIKKEQKIPYGTTINTLIEISYNCPNSAKKELIEFIKKRLKKLYKEMETADNKTFNEIKEQIQFYKSIAAIYNNGEHLSKEEIDAVILKQKIAVKNGYIICPDDWIIVNPEMAETSEYASVVEYNDGNKDISHLLVFTENKLVDKSNETQVNSIYEMCCKTYPQFSEILKPQVKPNNDTKDEESAKAPNIKIFDIYIQEKPKQEAGYKPHADVQIVRTTPINY